jgi:hypothetical protein
MREDKHMPGLDLVPSTSADYDRLHSRLDDAVNSGGAYAHNRVSAVLRLVDARFGAAAAAALIDEFDLTQIFGIRKPRGQQ